MTRSRCFSSIAPGGHVMAVATVQAPWIGRMLIGGQWHAGSGDDHFSSYNPAQADEVVGVYPRGTAADVDAAVEAARKAQPAWRRLSRIKRGAHLAKLAAL